MPNSQTGRGLEWAYPRLKASVLVFCPATRGPLQRALDKWPIKALVMTARAGNPMGATMPEARQRKLVAMMAQRQLTIIEDDIYGELKWMNDTFIP